MSRFFAFALLAVSLSSPAANLDCYIGANHVYHGQTEKFLVTDEYIVASYNGYDDMILRDSPHHPECVITKYLSEEPKHKKSKK